jgi:hypothetical protein
MNAKSTRAKVLIGSAVAVVVLYGANYMFTPDIVGITQLESFFRPKGALQFDSIKWKQKEKSAWGERYKMVDDLLKTQLRPGRSQQEVEDLLGKPDIAAPRDGGELELHYNLASQKDYPARSVLFPGRLQNLELWILLLRFREGRLYSVEVVPT